MTANLLRVRSSTLACSFVGNALVAGVGYHLFGNNLSSWLIPLWLVAYVAWSWYMPFFLATILSLRDCPHPFFYEGKFIASAWRSSRFSPMKGHYKEAGPFFYYGFAYLWARHWSLILDWYTAEEDFSVWYLVQRVD